MTKAKTTADPARIQRICDDIAAHKGANLTELLHRFATDEAMKLTEKPKAPGTWTCKMHGITVTATPTEAQALENWAAAARRALLRAI